jgi:threonine dehydrogenase-like Zn-dependent dehydrogenase
MHGPGDVRVEEREAPRIVEPTDAIIRVSVACVCGSDLWPYRGVEDMQWPAPMGHEYVGLTNGLGAHSVVEAVGTQESMMQAIHATRPGGHVGFVGVAYGVALDGMDLFWSLAHVHGGPAPVRRFLPVLIDLIWNRQINPGKVFDLELPLAEAADGYRAMDQREAIKVLLRPG